MIGVIRSLYPSRTAHQEAPLCQEETGQSDCDPSVPEAAEINQIITHHTSSVWIIHSSWVSSLTSRLSLLTACQLEETKPLLVVEQLFPTDCTNVYNRYRTPAVTSVLC